MKKISMKMTQVGALFCAAAVVAGGAAPVSADSRASTSKKGSLLILPNIEVKWDALGNVTQDTFVAITNDFPADVFVHFLFVDGDDARALEEVGAPVPLVIERAHTGWNFQNWTSKWTHDESSYFSVMTGQPKGAPPFANLDKGAEGPGRPDDELGDGSRVLRGFLVAWAVDNTGKAISWNHLSGSATIVHYGDMGAWEYNAYALQTAVPHNSPVGTGGELILDGSPGNYDGLYDMLLFDFYSSGSTPFDQGAASVMVETDLTLLPVYLDLRQNNNGPTHTKATFDIWNQNEDFFSGTHRCLWCWDQFLLSDIEGVNSFGIGILGTDKGKSRIDGEASSTVCDETNCCPRGDAICISFFFTAHGTDAPICSEAAPLLGVANKILGFSGLVSATAYSGRALVGQGKESGKILADVPTGPGTLIDGGTTSLGTLSSSAVTPARNVSIEKSKIRQR